MSIFNDTKSVYHNLKILIQGVFVIRYFNWNTAIMVFMEKCSIDQRRYKSRHLIPMFIKDTLFQYRTS